MVSFKALSLSAVCLVAAATSARADNIILWTVNVSYSDGTTITGSFDFNATEWAANPVTDANPLAGLDAFSNVDLYIAAGNPGLVGYTYSTPGAPTPLFDLVYADNTGIQIANAPASTADFTNVNTNNCGQDGQLPCGLPAFGTSLFGDIGADLALTAEGGDPGYDPGASIIFVETATSGAPPTADAGFCEDAICDTYANEPDDNPPLPVFGSGTFTATDGPNPSAAPEPSTFLLGGSVLALGLFRRKLLKRS